MIRYSLRCEHGHTFESWFQSGSAFDKLTAANRVACAVCGSDNIQKAIMAPRVTPARNSAPAPVASGKGALSQPASAAEQALKELRDQIEAKSEDVGTNFATEARAIHAGDAPMRPIIGQAELSEAKSLIDDGIPVAALPWSDRKAN